MYVRASLVRKVYTGECQFLGCRLISWQCKKQTVVANSTTEADYVAALSYYGQVLWIHNQLLDYSAKTTAWNEFSSTMASVIICLATNQKFNFSKYIFESMVKNLENVSDNVADKAVNEEMDDSLVVVPQAPNTMRDNNCTDSLRDSILNVPLIYCTQEKDQLKLDEEVAQRLQAEFDEQERIKRDKAEKEVEVNVAITKEWNDIQAKNEVDQLLAERLQAREQEELTINERAIIFQQLLEKRRKHFAAKRAKEKRNKPPTRAQQRSIMCTYLSQTRDRIGAQRFEEQNEEEVAIDAIPLATKPPTIGRIVGKRLHDDLEVTAAKLMLLVYKLLLLVKS
ncbi:hypothetical protein Tco_1318266 [Tanacetum coccineum]